MVLFVRINSEGREIEPRRQNLSFAERLTLMREAKTNFGNETKNKIRHARERPLTRERARNRGLDLKLLSVNEKDSIQRM